MAAASLQLWEDQFLCSICLDVFTDPVSTPCGHNFCKGCISEHWTTEATCHCPVCKRRYVTKPELQVNTFISEMAAQFRQSAEGRQSSSRSSRSSSSSRSEPQAAQPEDIPCDICTGTRLKAAKSCLVCLASYCETHLEPHLTRSGLMRHQLVEPVENLEDRMCPEHDKLLELFCKTDQTCICMLCSVLDHKVHKIVPLAEEYDGKKAELAKTGDEIQQMIQQRQRKVEEIQRSLELSKKDADREAEEGGQVFADIKKMEEEAQVEFLETITGKQKTVEKQAEDFIRELQQEISELTWQSSEVERLARSEDHLCLLQGFPPLKAAALSARDWTGVGVRPASHEGTAVRAAARLEETLRRKMAELFASELARARRFAVDVTLNPDVVHPEQPAAAARKKEHVCRCVLSPQGFSSGRFYFEVRVAKWWDWAVGVARRLTRNKKVPLNPENGYWAVCSKLHGRYVAPADPSLHISLGHQLGNVGVFVDYDEGLVSFYDADAAALICSLTDCIFGGEVFPFFSCCQNNGVVLHDRGGQCPVQ